MQPRDRAPDLVRIVVGKRGQVPMRMQLIIRFDSGPLGDFTIIGGLADVDGSTSGENVFALSWDPTIANPFDRGTGAFVAFAFPG